MRNMKIFKLIDLSSRSRCKGKYVSHGRNYVHSEAHKQRSNSGINRAKEWEYDRQKPNGYHHWKPSKSPLENAFCLVHADRFLPHKVERSACKSKCYELHGYTKIYFCCRNISLSKFLIFMKKLQNIAIFSLFARSISLWKNWKLSPYIPWFFTC